MHVQVRRRFAAAVEAGGWAGLRPVPGSRDEVRIDGRAVTRAEALAPVADVDPRSVKYELVPLAPDGSERPNGFAFDPAIDPPPGALAYATLTHSGPTAE